MDRTDQWLPPEDLLDDARAVAGEDRAALALVDDLGALRAALAVSTDELTARRHLAAMRAAGPVTTGPRRRHRRSAFTRRHVRTAAASLVTAATLLGGVGVAAANSALPAPLEHAVAGVAGAVGVHLPSASTSHRRNGGATHHPLPPAAGRGTGSPGAGPSGQGGSPSATTGGEPGGPAPQPGDGSASPRLTTPTSAPGAATPTGPSAPGASGSAPGRANRPSTTPADGGAPPGQSKQPGPPANPGNGGTPPGQTTKTTTPGHTGAAPGHANADASPNAGPHGNGAGNGRR
ncbi:MAG TPA: hypothetical protein VFC33_05355 [Acidimicrobiia bacterium]|nr:hypothetical protein [Acidimicrobiia bacterium]